ncbi:MAG: hypothetical protein WBG42_00090 [Cryomorphaceae bacterium]
MSAKNSHLFGVSVAAIQDQVMKGRLDKTQAAKPLQPYRNPIEPRRGDYFYFHAATSSYTKNTELPTR